jgi:hypothetical protein
VKRCACLALLLALCGPTLAPPAGAAMPPVSAPKAGREIWQKRIGEAREELSEARARHEAAVTAYGGVRHRRRARGARKQAALKERNDAEAALAEAENRLEDLLERARRAGIPPGWIRDVPQPSPAAPQP